MLTGMPPTHSCTPTVRVWHGTDAEHLTGIRQDGFARSHQGDMPDSVFFSGSDDWPQGARFWGQWIIVDLPADVADTYVYSDPGTEPRLRVYAFPFAVINQYRDVFQYEELSAERLPHLPFG
jgi:hypothetical protein